MNETGKEQAEKREGERTNEANEERTNKRETAMHVGT